MQFFRAFVSVRITNRNSISTCLGYSFSSRTNLLGGGRLQGVEFWHLSEIFPCPRVKGLKVRIAE